jgi:hypothetical protein
VSSFTDTRAQTGDPELLTLSSQTYEALAQSARRQGRTIHEEAEHIIKSHLAASGEEDA